MTQHPEEFIQDCITVTADGSLVSADEIEGLYLHWCSLRATPTSTASHDDSDGSDGFDDLDASGDSAAEDGSPLLDVLRTHGVVTVLNDGVEYLEGLVLTGPVVADFILSCDFAGAWGRPESQDLALLQDVASAS